MKRSLICPARRFDGQKRRGLIAVRQATGKRRKHMPLGWTQFPEAICSNAWRSLKNIEKARRMGQPLFAAPIGRQEKSRQLRADNISLSSAPSR